MSTHFSANVWPTKIFAISLSFIVAFEVVNVNAPAGDVPPTRRIVTVMPTVHAPAPFNVIAVPPAAEQRIYSLLSA